MSLLRLPVLQAAACQAPACWLSRLRLTACSTRGPLWSHAGMVLVLWCLAELWPGSCCRMAAAWGDTLDRGLNDTQGGSKATSCLFPFSSVLCFFYGLLEHLSCCRTAAAWLTPWAGTSNGAQGGRKATDSKSVPGMPCKVT